MKTTISFIVNPVANGWHPDDTRLGGTEESVVEWAERIATKGHRVRVYGNIKGNSQKIRGVYYHQRGAYKGGEGITINVKSSDIPRQEPTWYLTNEMNAGQLDLAQYDGVILPSRWALDNLEVQHRNIQILPHGYDSTKIFPKTKIRNQCLYTSSPDRGLSELVDLWPQIVEQVPDATLIVTYNGFLDAPNVLNMGDVDPETMNELYNTSQFWLHPCLGGELYCIAAVKAMAAHAIPVYYPTMALKETVRWGIRTHRETFVRKLLHAMTSNQYKHEMLAHAAVQEFPYPDWNITTDKLLSIIGIKPWS